MRYSVLQFEQPAEVGRALWADPILFIVDLYNENRLVVAALNNLF